MPRIDDIIDSLSNSNIFTTLNAASGYYQIEINEEDKEKTAFITKKGLYHFNVMPFGLCNAPATFQRLMNSALNELIVKYVMYILMIS